MKDDKKDIFIENAKQLKSEVDHEMEIPYIMERFRATVGE